MAIIFNFIQAQGSKDKTWSKTKLWPQFSTTVKYSLLLGGLYLPTYLFSPIRWKWYLSCLGAYCVYQCGYFSDLSTGDEFSPSLMSSLGMLNEEKENLLLIARDTQAAVKPLLFTALNKICLWITHTEHCVLLKMLEINIPEINIKHYDVGIPFAIIKQLKIAICLTSAVNTCISYY